MFKWLLLIFGLNIVACTKSPKPQFSLYILNSYDKKELIANFYQSTGLNDCESVKANWSSHKASCEISE